MDVKWILKKLALHRQSVRSYKSDSIDRQDILKCISSARMSPSACNSQPWKFVAVDDVEKKEQICSVTYNKVVKFNKFTHTAPVIIAVVIESTNIIADVGAAISDREFNLMDLGIAVENFCLQAADIGLGTCILGCFDEKKVKEILAVPKNKRIGLLITLGYPKSDIIREKDRKSIEIMSSFNTYKGE